MTCTKVALWFSLAASIAACGIIGAEDASTGSAQVETITSTTTSTSPITDESRPATGSIGPNFDPTTPLVLVPALETDEDTGIVSQGMIDGTVSINERCITWTFNPTGDEVTLAWHEGSAEYNSESNTVSFTSFITGEIQVIADGDQIDFGGLEATNFNTFVSKPDASCPLEVWLVNQVEPPS